MRDALLLLIGAATLAGWSTAERPGAPPPRAAANPEEGARLAARAVFHDRDGNQVGTAYLAAHDGMVHLDYELSDLPPGPHGFHFHAVGRCDAPTFEGAGDHFNPSGAAHGFDHPDGPHAGDLRNLEVDDDGKADDDTMNERVTLTPGAANSLLDADGTALIVHAMPDDYRTQPSGNSGDRIACAVIEPN